MPSRREADHRGGNRAAGGEYAYIQEPDQGDGPGARAKTDFDFHQLIVEFSEIQLFVDLHLALRGLFIKAVQINSSQYCSTWQPVAEHENIIEALKRRDPDEALYFMQSHVARSASRPLTSE